MDQAQTAKLVRLDGRKLEGGGQLVRIAVALSALAGRAIAIHHIRGTRTGKTGLKASHLAAVQTLAELSGSTTVKVQVGSSSIGFYPPSRDQNQDPASAPIRQTKSDIDIRLPTPGSVFLVFQALYPYLLHSTSTDRIRLSIVGGTNVSSSPSFDYVSQVLIPNFARLGLPPLSVQLEKRGWSSGPGAGHAHLGRVTFVIDTLRGRGGSGGSPTRPDGTLSSHAIPLMDLQQCRRGTISRIDITVLAPDDRLDDSNSHEGSQNTRGNKRSNKQSDSSSQYDEKHAPTETEECDGPGTVRTFLEHYVHKALRRRLKDLPPSVLPRRQSKASQDRFDVVPIETHLTEATHRRSCLYVLIVAHTSTGFRIGRDALYGSLGGQQKPKKPRRRDKRQDKPQDDIALRVKGLVDTCVDDFLRELHDPQLQAESAGHQPCVDEHMRDQLVVFEALSKITKAPKEQAVDDREDERYWSLHTRTAQWVCREMLEDGGSSNT
ncbi:RNA 3'-terminal phosphate cyclase domain-containing protein [Aspergillus venezuelensis]